MTNDTAPREDVSPNMARILNSRINALTERIERLEAQLREEIFTRTAMDELDEPPAIVVSDAAVQTAWQSWLDAPHDAYGSMRVAIEAAVAQMAKEAGTTEPSPDAARMRRLEWVARAAWMHLDLQASREELPDVYELANALTRANEVQP